MGLIIITPILADLAQGVWVKWIAAALADRASSRS